MAMLPTAYVTAAEADEVNSSVEWLALDVAEKDTALSWGRVYLDSSYRCNDPINEAEPSDNVRLANSLLGDYYARGLLYPSSESGDETGGRTLTAKTVTAGSVSISKSYDESGGSSSIDNYPDVTAAMVNAGCSITGAGGIGSMELIR